MLQFSNAKINIGLYVTGKRADGFHNIESIFAPIDLSDAVELIPANENSITIYGMEIPGDQAKNSCLKALELMQAKYNVGNYVIHLYKKIPTGAGLGGGSSNASVVLKLLRDVEDLDLTDQELEKLALQIGSDNPFFIENRAKYVTGRGEVMMDSDLNLRGYKLVLIYPNLHMSTKDAYKKVSITDATVDLRKLTASQLFSKEIGVTNAFQEPFCTTFPETTEILTQLRNAGAKYVSLSGSGSTFFGIFEQEQTITNQLELFAESNNYQYIESKIL